MAAASAEEAAASVGAALREVGKKMNAETFFTSEEQQRIHQAVIAAEKKTSGEIVPMVVTSSARYAEVETAGLAIGLGVGTLATFVLHDPWSWMQSQLLWPLAGAALGFAGCSVPAVKRRLISKDRMENAVDLRSLAAFAAHGLHHTRAHTGILILISLLEHRVEVLADKGINEKVSAGTWDDIVHIITAGLKSGKACDAFCQAIEHCGEILAEHFPRSPDDQDELANRLVTGR
ncbi:MAG TPA: TPM domain-containing protein [Candidatus Binatia bacterium]|nr:TPM domain-containing protein [Candidatus Binatia bacterium]